MHYIVHSPCTITRMSDNPNVFIAGYRPTSYYDQFLANVLEIAYLEHPLINSLTLILAIYLVGSIAYYLKKRSKHGKEAETEEWEYFFVDQEESKNGIAGTWQKTKVNRGSQTDKIDDSINDDSQNSSVDTGSSNSEISTAISRTAENHPDHELKHVIKEIKRMTSIFIEHENGLEIIHRKYKVELNSIRDEHHAELKIIRKEHKDKLESTHREQKDKLKSMRDEYQHKLEGIYQEHKDELKNMRDERQDELESVRGKHEAEPESFGEKHEAQPESNQVEWKAKLDTIVGKLESIRARRSSTEEPFVKRTPEVARSTIDNSTTGGIKSKLQDADDSVSGERVGDYQDAIEEIGDVMVGQGGMATILETDEM